MFIELDGGSKMYQPNDIELAANYVNTGKKKEAREILRNILSIDNRNERAWMIFADAAEKKEHEIKCLINVLKINPNNEEAKQRLFLLNNSITDNENQSQVINKRRICPYCKEVVKDDAIVCRYCGRNISTLNQRIKRFIKIFFRNLIILVILIIILYIIGGPIMGMVFQVYWLLFGPLGLLRLIVSALPYRR